MATEILTMRDKAQRDKLYEELRKSDNPEEREVVKFSGAEMIEGAISSVRYTATGKGGKINQGREQFRAVCRSTWSVAYPARPDDFPTARRVRKDKQIEREKTDEQSN
jgi:hypothetical protein